MESNTASIKKYQILENDSIQAVQPGGFGLKKLYRIIALRDFVTFGGRTIKAMEIGGYIHSENNLPHDDGSWVEHDARIINDAVVSGNTLICNRSVVCGFAKIIDSKITGACKISGNAFVKKSVISGNVDIDKDARVETSSVSNWSVVTDKASISETVMTDASRVSGTSVVHSSTLADQAEVKGFSNVRHCKLSGRTVISNKQISNQTINEQIELKERIGKE